MFNIQFNNFFFFLFLVLFFSCCKMSPKVNEEGTATDNSNESLFKKVSKINIVHRGGNVKGNSKVSTSGVTTKFKGNLCHVSGWAFVAEQNATNQKIYVAIFGDEDTVFVETKMSIRKDVDAAYSKKFDKKYDLENSGYEAEFSDEDLKTVGENAQLGLKIVNGDQEMITGFNMLLSILEIDPINRIDLGGMKNDSLIIALTLKEEENNVLFDGYTFLTYMDSYNTKPVIILNHKDLFFSVSSQEIIRKDLTKHFAKYKHNYDKSGFLSRLPKSALPKGTYDVWIGLEDKESGRTFYKNSNKKLVI